MSGIIKYQFSVINNLFLYDKEIPQSYKILIIFISNLSSTKGYCFASNAYLAELLDCTDRTIRNGIEFLINKGILKREVKKGENGDVSERRLYVLNDVEFNLSSKKYESLSRKLFSDGRKLISIGGGNYFPHNNTNINNNTYIGEKENFENSGVLSQKLTKQENRKIPTKKELYQMFKENSPSNHPEAKIKEMARSFWDSNESTGWHIKGSPITNVLPLVQKYIRSWLTIEAKNDKNIKQTEFRTSPKLRDASQI